MSTFTELLFSIEKFFSDISTENPNLAEDLIQLSRAIYNYNNAQRAQKVFQQLKRIHRINLAAKMTHAQNEISRLLLETRRYSVEQKNSNIEFYQALTLVIKPVLLDLLKVYKSCEQVFSMSKLKIKAHRE